MESLSTSDKLTLTNATYEGAIAKLTFIDSDKHLVSDSKVVYDLHMLIEALSKSLTNFDMLDVFQIIPKTTV